MVLLWASSCLPEQASPEQIKEGTAEPGRILSVSLMRKYISCLPVWDGRMALEVFFEVLL